MALVLVAHALSVVSVPQNAVAAGRMSRWFRPQAGEGARGLPSGQSGGASSQLPRFNQSTGLLPPGFPENPYINAPSSVGFISTLKNQSAPTLALSATVEYVSAAADGLFGTTMNGVANSVEAMGVARTAGRGVLPSQLAERVFGALMSPQPTSVLISSPVETGRTHLIHAIAQRIYQATVTARYQQLVAEQRQNQGPARSLRDLLAAPVASEVQSRLMAQAMTEAESRVPVRILGIDLMGILNTTQNNPSSGGLIARSIESAKADLLNILREVHNYNQVSTRAHRLYVYFPAIGRYLDMPHGQGGHRTMAHQMGEMLLEVMSGLDPSLRAYVVGDLSNEELGRVRRHNPSLSHRTETVSVEHYSREQDRQLLLQHANDLERHYALRGQVVVIDQGAVDRAYDLAARPMDNRFDNRLDRAAHILDQAVEAVTTAHAAGPTELSRLSHRIQEVEDELLRLEASQATREIQQRQQALRSEIRGLRDSYETLSGLWPAYRSGELPQLMARLVAELADVEQASSDASRVATLRTEVDQAQRALAMVQQFVFHHYGPQNEIVVGPRALLPITRNSSPGAAHVSEEFLLETEIERLMHLERRIGERVRGQDEAVSRLASGVIAHRLGHFPRVKAFLALLNGPSGAGKTELAKALAHALFGSDGPEVVLFLQMNTMANSHDLSRLVGAPPGYVGYEKGGELTEFVKRNPFGVVVLDEADKAHHSFWNILMRAVDEGKLTDVSTGRDLDCSGITFLATANFGAQILTRMEFVEAEIRELRASGASEEAIAPKLEHLAQAQRVYESISSQALPPWIRGRMDDIMRFRSLPEEVGTVLAVRALRNANSQLQRVGVSLYLQGQSLDEASGAADAILRGTNQSADGRTIQQNPVIALLAEAGFNPELGGRAIQNFVQRTLVQVTAQIGLAEGFAQTVVAQQFGGQLPPHLIANAETAGALMVYLDPATGNLKWHYRPSPCAAALRSSSQQPMEAEGQIDMSGFRQEIAETRAAMNRAAQAAMDQAGGAGAGGGAASSGSLPTQTERR